MLRRARRAPRPFCRSALAARVARAARSRRLCRHFRAALALPRVIRANPEAPQSTKPEPRPRVYPTAWQGVPGKVEKVEKVGARAPVSYLIGRIVPAI